MSVKGRKPDLDIHIDHEDMEFIQKVSRQVATQVMHQSKQQGAPVDLDDMEEQGIDMEFEAPVFVVAMVCTVLRAAVDTLGSKDVKQLAKAWMPMAKAAVMVHLDVDGEREMFNNSWEASE